MPKETEEQWIRRMADLEDECGGHVTAGGGPMKKDVEFVYQTKEECQAAGKHGIAFITSSAFQVCVYCGWPFRS